MQVMYTVMTTLKLSSYLLIYLCFLSLKTAFGLFNTTSDCKVSGCGCQCTNSNGTFQITMRDIQKFHVDAKTGSFAYDIDPCHEFSDGVHCSDVTVCQTSTKYGNFPIAKLKIESCGPFVDDKTPVTVTYAEVLGQGTYRRMVINFECGQTFVHDSVDEGQQTGTAKDPKIYTVGITDPGGCPTKVTPNDSDTGSSSGVSTGSVLVIVFFGLLVVYLVAGILFMKYQRGATGKEVIPNVGFWSSLPGLIKDGCAFFGKKMKELCDRCCKREGYDEI